MENSQETSCALVAKLVRVKSGYSQGVKIENQLATLEEWTAAYRETIRSPGRQIPGTLKQTLNQKWVLNLKGHPEE